MEIENRRQVDLGAADGELGDVGGPLRVRRLCLELAVQYVFGCLADIAAEGVVAFAAPHRAVQPELAHELEDRFLRHPPSLAKQDSEDTSVPVGAFRRVERIADSFLDAGPGVRTAEPAPVVVKCGPSKARDLQQKGQPVVPLEVVDSAYFQRCPADLKARNFPKYATSARNRSFSRRSASIWLSAGESARLVGGRPRRFGRNPSAPSRRKMLVQFATVLGDRKQYDFDQARDRAPT